MADIELQASIHIDASPANVWEALTTPELIKRWFFGVDTETDWRVGSPIVHRGEYRGSPYEDKGTVTRFEPERLLAHTHWSSVSGLPDEPANYQEVTYALVERDGRTQLTVREVNLPSEEAKAISERGWDASLRALKDLLET
jgi:uncharacterized protein YndB with AHSA1/START domain